MSKPRKPYRPKPVEMNPLIHFFGGLKRVDSEHLTELNVKNSKAMVSICGGTGTRADWDILVGMQNMALVLAEIHFDMQYHEMLIAGRDALHAVGIRWLEHKKFIFKGDELQSLNNSIEVHEAQLNALRVIDVERAYAEVQRRIKFHINTKKVMEMN